VREIETETFEENPLLFQEYICATPDMRVLMDNQFKNVKTHARLLSKAMWYEWRMKLLDGLRAGLIKIAEGMTADADILDYQQELLDRVLPGLQQQYESLFEEEADLQASAEELANCDQEELAEARDALVSLESDIEAKRRLVRELRNQIEDKEAGFKAATDKKQAYLEDIKEAEKIREECRGWTGNEIAAYKDKVDALEEQYGWTVTGVSGTTMSLAFRGDLELVFDASSFKADGKEKSPQTQNSRLDLWYIAANRERNPLPETLEKKFFVDSIRDSIRALVQSETLIKELLGRVSAGWETSLKIVHQIEALNRVCPTEVTKTSDSSIMVRAMLLLIPLNSKVDLQFNISTSNAGDGLEIAIDPVVNVVYGEKFNEKNMTQFMITRVGTTVNEKATEKIAWTDAVKELEQRLLARGKKP
jgi:kinetochore protein Spc7/SPC105